MTKLEAAEFLGVSTRAIERYTTKGQLSVQYDKQGHAQYLASDVKQLKVQMAAKAEAPKAIARRDPAPKLTRSMANLSELLVPIISESVTQAIHAAQPAAPPVSLSEKLMLTLNDAASLSGLSKAILLDAIRTKNRAKKLKAQKLGKGWKVKRADLESYIKKL
jgi:DNA-binding transcriptional MerR regulator